MFDIKNRSLEQNAKLWGCLRDIAKQVPWVVNGKSVKMCEDDWKNVFSAALHKEQRIAQGLDGGWVMLGVRTSRMTKGEMADLIDLILRFGAEHKVRFSDPELDSMDAAA